MYLLIILSNILLIKNARWVHLFIDALGHSHSAYRLLGSIKQDTDLTSRGGSVELAIPGSAVKC